MMFGIIGYINWCCFGIKKAISDWTTAYEYFDISYNDHIEDHDSFIPVSLFIDKIIVPTEKDKKELLRVIKFFHDSLQEIDDPSVYDFCHLYLTPELIESDGDVTDG